VIDVPNQDPAEYVRNYRNSIIPAKIKVAMEKVEKTAKRNGMGAQWDLKVFQDRIKEILFKHGVPPDIMHFYIAYGEELKYVVAKFEWLTDRIREHKIIRKKWEGRGLDPNILDEIDNLVPWYGGRVR